MTSITKIAPLSEFEQAVSAHWITKQYHQLAPYVIYNYTARTQYSRHWNHVTTAARGLIVNYETQEIVARPFPKFFNYGETTTPLPLHEKIDVTEKIDGSLGILYQLPDLSWAIATMGNFESTQAIHATRLYHSRYFDFIPNPNWTYLFEIVYPQNRLESRLVIDYQDFDDLILLGAIDCESGKAIPYQQASLNWKGPTVKHYAFSSLQEVLSLPPRANQEGFVITFLDSDLRLKFKFPEYRKLSRILADLTEKKVWEHLSAGREPSELTAPLPDAFHPLATTMITALQKKYAQVDHQLQADFSKLKHLSRKDFALHIKHHPFKSAFFDLYDQKDTSSFIWNYIRPTPEASFSSVHSRQPAPSNHSLL